MKKKLILSAFILIVVTLTVILLGQNNERVIYSSKINELPTADALAMMYETESGSGEYVISDDTSWPLEGYVFNAELSRCENGSKLYWDEETKSVMMEANVSDKCYVYFDVATLEDLCNGLSLSECITTQVYTGTDGDNGLYYHDGVGNYINADQEAGDYSYRFSGANPNNYVCFGSDETICPEDNLYRIIGVFDSEVKLIKATSYGEYEYDEDNNNTWNSTTKPDIYTTLNTTYYNTLESKWQNLIADHIFEVGGMTRDDSYTVKQYYDVEVGTGQTGYEETMKIGLMYASDFGYGVSPETWTMSLGSNSSNFGTDNWLYLDSDEWLISPRSDSTGYSFIVYAYIRGSVNNLYVYATEIVRPCFYLNSNVTMTSGTGTESDPYRIA